MNVSQLPSPLPGAPTNVGNYTVVARFAGSANYSAASDLHTFAIIDSAAGLTGSSGITTIGGVEGLSDASLVAASFTYSNLGAIASTFTTSIDWGDGTVTDTTATVSGSNGNFSVQGSHFYLEDGDYPVTITVTDNGGKTASVTGTATVADAPLSNVVNVPFTPVVGSPFAGTVASFTDTNVGTADFPTIDPADYSATITWGDGSTSAGTIAYTGTPGRFTVNASDAPHTYATNGAQSSGFFVTVEHGSLTPVNTPSVSVTVADVVYAGSLQFITTGNFVNQAGVYTTSALTQVGFGPDPDSLLPFTFTPMVTLGGNVTIDTVSATFNNTGAVTDDLTGDSTVLLAGGFPIGTPIATLVDADGNGINVSGASLLVGSSPFIPDSLQFAHDDDGNSEIHLQGALTLPNGLRINAGPDNFVNVNSDGIKLSGTSSGASLEGSLTVGGLTISLANLSITNDNITLDGGVIGITSEENVFTISGDCLVEVVGWPAVLVTVNGEIKNGAINSFSLTLDNNVTFQLAGITVTSLAGNPLKLSYSADEGEFTLTGGAKLDVPGMGAPFFVTAEGTINEGALQSLNFTAVTSQVLTIAGVTVTTTVANPLSLNFLDFSSPTSRFVLTGSATIEVTGLGNSLEVTATGTVSSGQLQNLELTLSTEASLSVGTVTVFPTDLRLKYVSSGNTLTVDDVEYPGPTFEIAGSATIDVPGLGDPFHVTAAGAISNGELQSLELSVASNAAISVAGVTIATTADNPLTFGYVLAADNQFTVTGSATVSIPGLGSSIDVTTAGVVSDGELQSLDLDVVANQVLTVSGVSVTANTLSFSYLLSEGNKFTVEGNATIEVLRLDNTINVTASGTISNDKLQSLDLALESTAYSIGGLTVDSTSLTVAYTPSSFTLSGEAVVTIPETNTQFTFSASGLLGNALQLLTLTGTASNASFPLAGATVSPTLLTFTYEAAQDQFSMSGAASVEFPVIGAIDTTFSGQVVNNALRNFTFTAAANSTFMVAGVSISAAELTFEYSYDDVGGTFEIAGSGSTAFPVFGTYNTKVTGLISSNELTSFTLQVTSANTLLLLAGVSVTPISLSLEYARDAGVDTFTAAGVASVAFPTFGTIVTRISGVVANNAFETLSLKATSSNVQVNLPGGLTVRPSGLEFSYDSAGPEFNLGGIASITVPTFGTFAITASGTISANVLQSLTFTAGSDNASFVIASATIAPRSLTFDYAAPSTFTVGGAATVTFPSLGTLDVEALGTISQNVLQSLTLTATLTDNPAWSTNGISITPKSLELTYQASPLTFSFAGAAHVTITNPLVMDTDVVVGGAFANGGLQRLSLGLSDASSINIDVTMHVGSITPRINGGLTGPLTLSLTKLSSPNPHLEVSGDSTHPLVQGTLNVSGFPGVNISGPILVGFSLGINSAGVVDQATVDITGTLSTGFKVFKVSVTNPSFSYQASPAELSLSGSASATIGNDTTTFATAVVTLGDAAANKPGLVWKNGALDNAYIKNFGANVIIPSVASVTLSDFMFDYQPNASPSVFKASGRIQATVLTGVVNVSLPPIDFNNGTLASFVIPNVNATFAGLSLKATNVRVGFGVNIGTFLPSLTVSGVGSVTVAGATVTATFGSGSTPGLTFANSALPTQADITLNGDMGLPGVVIVRAAGLHLTYTASTLTFNLSGSTTVFIPALGNTGVGVTLGNPATSTPGISIVNGVLKTVFVTINPGSTMDLAGIMQVTTSSGVTLSYDSNTSTLQFYGSVTASLSAFPAAGNLNITFGNSAAPGLLIRNGALVSMNATATANLKLVGLTLANANLGLAWSSGVLSLWGGATASIGGLANLTYVMGSSSDPGLTINTQTAQLTKLRGTISSNLKFGSLTLSGATTLAYASNSFGFSGNLTASLSSLSFVANVSGAMTTTGTLTSLNFSGNANIGLFDVTLGNLAVVGSYSAATDAISLTGTATVSLPAFIPDVIATFLGGRSLGSLSTSIYVTPNVATSYVGIAIVIGGTTYGVNVYGDLSQKYSPASLDALLHPVATVVNAVVSVVEDIGSFLGSLGPLDGATIYYDANGDLIQDPDEQFTVTGPDGGFTPINTSSSTVGQLVTSGGTDFSTNLPNTLVLTAPADVGIVTPLTTLVNQLMIQNVDPDMIYNSKKQMAFAQVNQALGIASTINPIAQNVLQLALAGNADAADAFAAEVGLTAFVTEVAGLLSGLPGAGSAESLSTTVFSSLARFIRNSPGARLDLSDPAIVEDLINAAASDAALSIDPSIVSGAATVITAVNKKIEALIIPGDSNFLGSVVQVQVVSVRDITADLKEAAAGTMAIADVVANYTGTALDDKVNGAVIGNLNPYSTLLSIVPLVSQDVGAGQPATFDFLVYLTTSAPLTEDVTVNYTTEDLVGASAAAGDYTPVSGTLTWTAGGSTAPQIISVPVHVAGPIVQNKLFKVVLSNATNADVVNIYGVGDIQAADFATSTVLTTSAGPWKAGDPGTFTATVTNQDATLSPANGTVTFFDGAVELGTVTLVSGSADFVTSTLTGGSHTITAVYNGFDISGAHYLTSVSADLLQIVAQAEQSITFTTPADQSYGAVDLLLEATATSELPVNYRIVSGPASISGDFLRITGAGTVVVEASQLGDSDYNAALPVQRSFLVSRAPLTFTVDDLAVAYGAPLPTLTGLFSGFVNEDDSGSVTTQPTFSIDPAVGEAGIYVISASGDVSDNYELSYVSGTLTVTQAASLLSLVPVPAATVYGQTTTLTVNVTNGDSGTGTPTGTVTFFDDGIELSSVPLSNGSASLTLSNWSVGGHALTASYDGDLNFTANGSDIQTLTVSQDASVASLSIGAGQSAAGSVLTATITAAAPGSGTPTGTVQFVNGTTVIETVTLTNGTASIPIGSAVATQVSVYYLGDVNFLPGSAIGAQAPAVVEDDVSLISSASGNATFGPPLTFTANVTAVSPAGPPVGSVLFLDGTVLLETVPLVNGAASYTPYLTVGEHAISAVYIGDDGYEASSPIVHSGIDFATPTLTINAAGGVYNGQAIGATATVAGVIAGVDSAPGNSLEGIGLSLNYQLLDDNGNFVEDLGSVAPTHGGTYLVIATFAGSADYAATTASAVYVISQASVLISVTGYSAVYDGNAHGASGTATGINGEDLSQLLSLGSRFTAGPGGVANWSFAGNTDYASASGHVDIAIRKATANLNVSGYGGIYDGNEHGAVAAPTGVNGEDLSDLFSPGSFFADAPGGIAHWTFFGDNNYAAASGDVAIEISKAVATFPVSGFSGSYDGRAHGATASPTGVQGEDLSGLFSAGATFTNVSTNVAHWIFLGNQNYEPTSGDVTIEIGRALANIRVDAFNGRYDGNAHRASGSATGVNGEDLSSLLNLGASFTILPGGTAHWTFAGNASYLPTSGDVVNVINQPTIVTARFSADTGLSDSDLITSTAAQTISGTTSLVLVSGEFVQVSLDAGNTWSTATTSVGSNIWSFNTTLTGSNTLRVRVSDAAGKLSPVYAQVYTLDTTAPNAPSIPDLASGSDSGTLDTDNLTNVTTPTFTGTADSDTTVTLYDTDGTTVLGTSLATDGTWLITSSVLGAGVHTISATATDTAGNVTRSASGLTITIDSSLPVLVGFTRQMPAASPTNDDTLMFRATFNETVDGVDVADFIVNGTTAIVTVVSPVAGSNGQQYDITVAGDNLSRFNGIVGLDVSPSPTITDIAGNQLPGLEPATDQTYLLDHISPTVTITPNGTTTSASPILFTFQFTETVFNFDAADIAITNGNKGTFTAIDGDTYTLEVLPTADGTVSINVCANVTNDAAANGNLAASAAITSDRSGPVFTSAATASIAENVAMVLTAVATDAHGPVTFSILGGADATLFTIGASSGTLQFLLLPDFEVPADSGADNFYNLQIGASDAFGQTTVQDITITVTPVNDNVPVFTSPAAFPVPENTMPVGIVVATDTDLPRQSITFSVTGGADSALFDIDAATGLLAFITAPDFESPLDNGEDNVYDVEVTANDRSGSTNIQHIAVTVTPVNDHGPVFTSATRFDVMEDVTQVGTVATTDADLPAQTVTCSITGGADSVLFHIGAATGLLDFITAPDFESPLDAGADNIYQVDVTADDHSGLTTIQSVVVTVTPINDNSPIFTSAMAFNLAENSTSVGMVVAQDADRSTQSLSYSIVGGSDSALFSIDPTTGSLSFTTDPDFESPADDNTDNIYHVAVMANDGSGSTTIQNITVTVTPVNDNFPVFTSPVAFNLSENTIAVATVSATDADLPTQTVNYSITGGADGALFQIDPTTGALTFITPPDFESPTAAGAGNLYLIDVTADDHSGSTALQHISITVTPANDNAPVFTSTVAFHVSENASAIGVISATDADVPVQVLSYSITGGADAAMFHIDHASGALTFITAPDFESPADAGADHVYHLSVTADDNSGSTSVQEVEVTVTPVNDNAPVFTSLATFNISENVTDAGNVTAADADLPGQIVTYGITGGVDAALFSIDPQTGRLSFLSAPDYEHPTDVGANNSYEAQVTADDGSGLSTVQDLTVNVTNFVEAPVITLKPETGTYHLGKEFGLVDPTAQYQADVTKTDYAAAVLTVSISANRQSRDILDINPDGNNAGEIGIKGRRILFGGEVIGTFRGGKRSTPDLVIRFNAAATEAAVQALVKRISIVEKHGRLPQPTRTVQMQITNVSGHNSNHATRNIDFIDSN